MTDDFSLIEVIRFLLKKTRIIIILSFAVAVITAGVTMLMPNYYESSTEFYAASPELSAPTPLSTSQQRIAVYGNDEDLDRLLSIANSNQLLEFLIDTFDLYAHYNIDRNHPKSTYKVKKKLTKHLNVLKTKFGAIQLTIEDQDPVVSAAMANAAREKVSKIAQLLIKDSQKNTIENYVKNIDNKNLSLKQLSDSIFSLKDQYGIIDVASQGEVLATSSTEAGLSYSENLARLRAMEEMNMPQDSINKIKAKIAGYKSKKASVAQQLEQYNKGISQIKTLENQLILTNDQVGLMTERLSQLKAAYDNPFTALHVVEYALVPIVKSSPKRSLIVIASAFLTFILISLGLLLTDSLSKIDWN